jgi:cell division transport system permease protein
VNRGAVRHAFVEAWSICRSSPGRTLLAVALIAISLYIPGLLLLLCQNLARLASRAEAVPAAEVTLAAGADARALALEIARDGAVRRVRIVSPEAARERFERNFPDLRAPLAQLPDVPFPTTLEVELAPGARSAGVLASLAGRPGVDSVSADAEFEQRLKDFVSLSRRASLFLGGLLAGAAVVSIASAVRLAMDQHREEIEIMRLMGATEATIRAPFWLQGSLEGAVGGIAALGVLLATYGVVTMAMHRSPHPILSIFWVHFFPLRDWLLFPLLGLAAGFLGAAASVGRRPQG